jgi:hypothetical protein
MIAIVLVSCSKKPVPKPDNLLSKEVMEEIIYELAILQAAESHRPQVLIDNEIEVKQFIYKKHNIDSITYFQNYKYYASDIKSFKKIYKHVNERIQNQKNEIDTLVKDKKIEKTTDPAIYTPQIK